MTHALPAVLCCLTSASVIVLPGGAAQRSGVKSQREGRQLRRSWTKARATACWHSEPHLEASAQWLGLPSLDAAGPGLQACLL